MRTRVITMMVIAILTACSKDKTVDPLPEPTSFVDVRDGQTYNIKKIGTQVWMTQNLNYATGVSYCDDCPTCGRLYDWNTAKTAAPAGWHLPSDAEWMILIDFLGGMQEAGSKMKLQAMWSSPNTGATNSSGFTGLPCGYRHINGLHFGTGQAGFWWSSTVATERPGYAHNMGMSYNTTGAGIAYLQQQYGLSVRCVKD